MYKYAIYSSCAPRQSIKLVGWFVEIRAATAEHIKLAFDFQIRDFPVLITTVRHVSTHNHGDPLLKHLLQMLHATRTNETWDVAVELQKLITGILHCFILCHPPSWRSLADPSPTRCRPAQVHTWKSAEPASR